jgi:peptidoglycan/xylan/chitin deacetylase (PgdA/CDA1 family)
MRAGTPDDFDPRTICLSVDVEWASMAVLADLRSLLDQRGLKATFFVTHDGVSLPGHERGIHPNFRRDGDVMKAFLAQATAADDATIGEHVVAAFKRFAPEARGVRAHSLHYDSTLLPVYQRHGIEYDSSYQIPLVGGLTPFWKEHDLLELPIYFNDYFELKSAATACDLRNLNVEASGLKVINFHPNIVFLNAHSLAHYQATREFYHDPERLLAARHEGKGVRTLVLDLLDRIVSARLPTMTLGEVNRLWRIAREARR